MRESSAPNRTGKSCRALAYDGEWNAKQPDALDDVGHRPGHDKERQPDPERCQDRHLAFGRRNDRDRHQANSEGGHQPLRNPEDITTLPRQERPEWHGK